MRTVAVHITLVFNATSTKDGLIQICEQNLFGDAPFGKITDYPDRLQIFTNYINDALNRYFIIALSADGSWKVDDTNSVDFPVATTSLVSNTADYQLNSDQIIVDSVEILDTNGTTWRALPEMDTRQFALYQQSLSQFNNQVVGIPTVHVKTGSTIVLYPTPNYSVNAGLRLRFKRPPGYFSVSDTTKPLGINRLHHPYITDYATWKYAFSRTMTEIANSYQGVVTRWEKEDIPEFFSKRSAEAPNHITSVITRSR